MGQAFVKLDCAMTRVYAVSMAWLPLYISPKPAWMCSSVAEQASLNCLDGIAKLCIPDDQAASFATTT